MRFTVASLLAVCALIATCHVVAAVICCGVETTRKQVTDLLPTCRYISPEGKSCQKKVKIYLNHCYECNTSKRDTAENYCKRHASS